MAPAGKMNTEVPITPDGVVYHLGCRKEDVADNILLVGDPNRVPIVAALFDKGSLRVHITNREIVTMTGTYNGVPVTAMSTGMGTDNVEIVITELHIVKEYDVKTQSWGAPAKLNLIRCGTCGSPQESVDAGTLAITQLGVGLDGTGRFYSHDLQKDTAGTNPNGSINARPGVAELLAEIHQSPLSRIPAYVTSAHPDITNTLASIARNRPRPHVVGHTASACGFYACQGRRVGRLQSLQFPDLPKILASFRADNKKVNNIEMENSSLCHISHMLGYRAGTVCVVIASRASGTKAMLPKDEAQLAMEDCLRLALDAFVQLSRKQAHL